MKYAEAGQELKLWDIFQYSACEYLVTSIDNGLCSVKITSDRSVPTACGREFTSQLKSNLENIGTFVRSTADFEEQEFLEIFSLPADFKINDDSIVITVGGIVIPQKENSILKTLSMTVKLESGSEPFGIFRHLLQPPTEQKVNHDYTCMFDLLASLKSGDMLARGTLAMKIIQNTSNCIMVTSAMQEGFDDLQIFDYDEIAEITDPRKCTVTRNKYPDILDLYKTDKGIT